jgi:hypothetical protein
MLYIGIAAVRARHAVPFCVIPTVGRAAAAAEGSTTVSLMLVRATRASPKPRQGRKVVSPRRKPWDTIAPPFLLALKGRQNPLSHFSCRWHFSHLFLAFSLFWLYSYHAILILSLTKKDRFHRSCKGDLLCRLNPFSMSRPPQRFWGSRNEVFSTFTIRGDFHLCESGSISGFAPATWNNILLNI